MKVGEFDSVTMRDGRTGSVCEVLKPGAAYLVDFPKPLDTELGRDHGVVTFETELVAHGDIASVTTS